MQKQRSVNPAPPDANRVHAHLSTQIAQRIILDYSDVLNLKKEYSEVPPKGSLLGAELDPVVLENNFGESTDSQGRARNSDLLENAERTDFSPQRAI